jgi:hypothetical protein
MITSKCQAAAGFQTCSVAVPASEWKIWVDAPVRRQNALSAQNSAQVRQRSSVPGLSAVCDASINHPHEKIAQNAQNHD